MANFFQNILARLATTGDKDQSVIGIDIGSSSIKIVQLKRKGARAMLETYGELSFGPYAGVSVGMATNLPQDKIVEALHDLLTEKEVSISTTLAGVAIPFSSSLMTVVQMPEVPPKELATMVPIEARKYIPVPISEVSLDWSVIPKSNNTPSATDANFSQVALTKENELQNQLLKKRLPMLDVLIVAIHNDTLNRYNQIVTKNNLLVSFFEIEIFSTMRSVIEETLAPVMIFDMGAATTKLFIVERGLLRASHTINRGSQDMTISIAESFGIPQDKAEVMKRDVGLASQTGEGADVSRIIMLTLDYIFSEANRIIVDFQKNNNKTVSKVILVGGGSSLKGLHEVAQKSFQTEVVSGDPFSKVVTPAFLEEVLRQTGPQFAVAVGLALRRLQEL